MPITIDNSRAINNERQQLGELESAYGKIQIAKQKLLEDSWPDEVRLSVYESELQKVQEQIKAVKAKIVEATEAKEAFLLLIGEADRLFLIIPTYTTWRNRLNRYKII